MELRPYQEHALAAVEAGWKQWTRQLGVAATGAGKTILFAHVAKQWLERKRGKVLIMAHREELVDQALAKLHAAVGVFAQKEQAEHRAERMHECVVASVQTMGYRLARWPVDHFSLLILDEAHHALSDSWQAVVGRFPNACVLGVTATPNRSDKRRLGKYFEHIAFEVGLLELVRDGFLSPIRAKKLEVGLALDALRSRRDYSLEDGARALSPHIEAVAMALAYECWDRKLLVFLPLRRISVDFTDALKRHGIDARHVDGSSADRQEALRWFAEPGPRALCNAMLLTEGFDQPDVDAICCLRPTQSRSLYSQIIGRGTRKAPGKEYLLVLDPLWLTGDHNLCQPADIAAGSTVHRDALQERLEQGMELVEAEEQAERDIEALLEARLKAAKKKKTPRGLVDPVALAVAIGDGDLADWEPTLPWHSLPATPDQLARLAQWKIHTADMCAGLAEALLARIALRDRLGLATPAQVVLCRRFESSTIHAERLTRGQAGQLLSRRLRK